jgi:hypothetical protein
MVADQEDSTAPMSKSTTGRDPEPVPFTFHSHKPVPLSQS